MTEAMGGPPPVRAAGASLLERSVGIIAEAQTPSGAILAAPAFPVYRYCWFRDASFAAYAMDRAGRHDVSRRFFDWGRDVIDRHAPRIESALRRRAAGIAVTDDELLHCRYAPDGSEGTEEWGNFQMDGYGSFLWALAHHVRRTGAPIAPYGQTTALLVRYVEALWDEPQYDCWEEAPGRYTSTAACLYGGLRAIAPLLDGPDGKRARATAERIRAATLREGVRGGRLVKEFARGGIDASLLFCLVPFGIVDATDPIAPATVAAIERELLNGGLHRFPEDTFYGGGPWIVLTAWLGWWYARIGRLADARALLAWIESHVRADGALPEQVQDSLLAPAYLEIWKGRWGPPACPLIWSHAMYVVLREELEADPPRGPGVAAEREGTRRGRNEP